MKIVIIGNGIAGITVAARLRELEPDPETVLIAVGIRPRIELCREAGLAVDRGVLVDEHLRSDGLDPSRRIRHSYMSAASRKRRIRAIRP